MIRGFLAVLIGFTTLYSGIVNGVAVRVNEDIVTLYELDQVMQKQRVSKEEAVEFMINEKLREAEIERLGISIDSFELEGRIMEIARNNNLTLEGFKEVLAARLIGYEEYKDQIENQMIQERLARKVFSEEETIIDTADARLYYDNHPEEFRSATHVNVRKYVAQNRNELINFLRNPMMISSRIAVEEESIEIASLNPRLKAIINETKEGRFTPPIPLSQTLFVSLQVLEKVGEHLREFDDVKGEITQRLRNENRGLAIERYFNKLRARAKISYLR